MFFDPSRQDSIPSSGPSSLAYVLMMPYERLEAWQACHQLFLETYRVTQSFPKSELYGLTSQMRRAAFSAAANVAEGSAKRGRSEEHTSELQSRLHLVCRLLLEKKKLMWYTQQRA